MDLNQEPIAYRAIALPIELCLHMGYLHGYAPWSPGPQPGTLLLSYRHHLEQSTGIEPVPIPWQGIILPLN